MLWSIFKDALRFLYVALPFLIMVGPYTDFVPIWDGALYAEETLKSVRDDFDVWGLNIAGHPGIGSLLVPALFAKLAGGQLWGLHLGNIALGIVAVISFQCIIDTLFAELPRAERSLIALVFSSIPVVAANSINTNLDFGTLVFSLVFLSLLVRRHFWFAALAGGMLVLAKESGVVVWGITLGVYSLALIFERGYSFKQKVRKLLKISPAFMSIIALIWYIAIRIKKNQGILWNGLGTKGIGTPHDIRLPSVYDHVFQAYVATIFSMNFMWIPSIFIMLGFTAFVIKQLFRLWHCRFTYRDLLICGLPCALLIALTTCRTFTNVRYFLPLFPVIILAFAQALQVLIENYRVRMLILGITSAAFLISAFRTIDPISRRIFGTFAFGSHSMLDITSITKECCGRGRDQLAYNLEFTHINHLVNMIYSDLRPSESQPVVLAELANWFLLSWTTLSEPPRRSLFGPNVKPTAVKLAKEIVSSPTPPKSIFWINMPNIDGEAELAVLKGRYITTSERRYDRSGYSLSVFVMTLVS